MDTGAGVTCYYRAKKIIYDHTALLYPNPIAAASPVHTFYGGHEQLIMVFLLRETGTLET